MSLVTEEYPRISAIIPASWFNQIEAAMVALKPLHTTMHLRFNGSGAGYMVVESAETPHPLATKWVRIDAFPQGNDPLPEGEYSLVLHDTDFQISLLRGLGKMEEGVKVILILDSTPDTSAPRAVRQMHIRANGRQVSLIGGIKPPRAFRASPDDILSSVLSVIHLDVVMDGTTWEQFNKLRRSSKHNDQVSIFSREGAVFISGDVTWEFEIKSEAAEEINFRFLGKYLRLDTKKVDYRIRIGNAVVIDDGYTVLVQGITRS